MDFDIDNFRVMRSGGEYWEADLLAILHYYQDKYFTDVNQPIEAAEFVTSIEEGSPACVRPHAHLIEVDERFRNFPKLCCFLVLHELVNNKLLHKYSAVQAYESPEFQEEIESLFKKGAYFGVL